ncbi:MAG: hypothetical protein GX838_06685 [Clostridiaceae bacterium]|nr:hypothetical protein [Clostridiaceae bacterium]
MRAFFQETKRGSWAGVIDLPCCGQDGKRLRKFIYGDTRSECERQLLLLTKKLEADGSSCFRVITYRPGTMPE